MPESDDYLSVQETADLLGLSQHSLNSWRSARTHLPYRKINGRVFYDRVAVEAFNAQRSEGDYFPVLENDL